MRLLYILFLFSTLAAGAINAPVNLLRACIDNDNLSITLSWKTPTDGCGSFTQHEIYGSENNGPFVLLDVITDFTQVEYVHSLSAINTNWRYYIVTANTCDGVGLVSSDTITVDITQPMQIELDSVSYDVNTQHIIAGWQSNPAPDTKEYQIYNFSSGNGDSIGVTTSTFYTVTTNPNNRFPVVIATLDSCNLSSLISEPHTPAFLNASIDTCANQISLNWSLYRGWSIVDSQVLFVSFNHQPHTWHQTFNSSTTSLTFNDFNLGDTVDFYIRTYSNSLTSSSNRRRIETRKLVKPNITYLNYVSVENESIEISWQSIPDIDIENYIIEKSDDGVNYTQLTTVPKTQILHIDNFVNPSLQSYYYQIIPINKCNLKVDTSNIGRSILLSMEPQLNHNNYIDWENGTDNYELEYSPDGSTWSTIENSATPITLQPEQIETGCYRIRASESTNSLNENNASFSNTRCKIDSLFIEVTTGINPNTLNNRFMVYGRGVDHDNSNFTIFNRWGEKLYDGRTDQSWDLNYNGKPVSAGVYLYVVNARGVLGEKQTIKGTFHVVR